LTQSAVQHAITAIRNVAVNHARVRLGFLHTVTSTCVCVCVCVCIVRAQKCQYVCNFTCAIVCVYVYVCVCVCVFVHACVSVCVH
jgi:hypothetical protein